MQLSKKIKKLDFEERFSLFEISNFLEKEIYKDLCATYPDPSLFLAHNDFAKSLNDDSDNFVNFLEKNNQWKIFIEKLNTKLFAEDLIKLFNLKNVYFQKITGKKIFQTLKKLN